MSETFTPTPALQNLRSLVGRVKALDEPLALDLSASIGNVLTEAESGAIAGVLDHQSWSLREPVPMDEEVARLLGEAVNS